MENVTEVVMATDINNVDFYTREAYINMVRLMSAKTTTGLSIEYIPSLFSFDHKIDTEFYNKHLELVSLDQPADLINYIYKIRDTDTTFPVNILDTYITDRINFYLRQVLGFTFRIENSFTDIEELFNIPDVINHPNIKDLLKNIELYLNLNYNNKHVLTKHIEEEVKENDGLYYYPIVLLDIIPVAALGHKCYYNHKQIIANSNNTLIEKDSLLGKIFTNIVNTNDKIKYIGYFILYINLNTYNILSNKSYPVVCKHDGNFVLNPII